LSAAVRKFCNRKNTGTHSAVRDVIASIEVLEGLPATYPDIPWNIDELHSHLVDVDIEGWFKRVDGAIVFARRKHSGCQIEQVAKMEPSYLRWLADRVLPDARQIVDDAASSGGVAPRKPAVR
jgi:hypothetical protein